MERAWVSLLLTARPFRGTCCSLSIRTLTSYLSNFTCQLSLVRLIRRTLAFNGWKTMIHLDRYQYSSPLSLYSIFTQRWIIPSHSSLVYSPRLLSIEASTEIELTSTWQFGSDIFSSRLTERRELNFSWARDMASSSPSYTVIRFRATGAWHVGGMDRFSLNLLKESYNSWFKSQRQCAAGKMIVHKQKTDKSILSRYPL